MLVGSRSVDGKEEQWRLTLVQGGPSEKGVNAQTIFLFFSRITNFYFFGARAFCSVYLDKKKNFPSSRSNPRPGHVGIRQSKLQVSIRMLIAQRLTATHSLLEQKNPGLDFVFLEQTHNNTTFATPEINSNVVVVWRDGWVTPLSTPSHLFF
jgi:hypothetical protein